MPLASVASDNKRRTIQSARRMDRQSRLRCAAKCGGHHETDQKGSSIHLMVLARIDSDNLECDTIQ